jgi:ribosomal protein S18 acetylase RimI-like enzyme
VHSVRKNALAVPSTPGLRVWRAAEPDRQEAFRLVDEYNHAVGVLVRDSEESFARDYFAPGSGLWLAEVEGQMAGCIALRPLPACGRAGEIKRLYVRPQFRGVRPQFGGMGVAQALLLALEQYGESHGHQCLYLDSKDDLTAALRFYQRNGYQICARYNANPQATVFLRKQLAAGGATEPASG